MALDPDRLLAHRFPEIEHSYTPRDAILYALGIGLGGDPLDANELEYLLEDRLKVLATMAVTLASPGRWVADPALRIDALRLVHSVQAATFHADLPPSASVTGSARIADLYDRGSEKGAVAVVERTIRDTSDGRLYCTLRQTLLLRRDGGFGGSPPPREDAEPTPDRPADLKLSVSVSPRAALIYRLSGDWNLIHADPDVARRAGFDRPILHGLGSYGIAGWALLRAFGGDAARRLTALSMRFAGLVCPGDRLTFEIWRENEALLFTASVGDRTVLDRGKATFEERDAL